MSLLTHRSTTHVVALRHPHILDHPPPLYPLLLSLLQGLPAMLSPLMLVLLEYPTLMTSINQSGLAKSIMSFTLVFGSVFLATGAYFQISTFQLSAYSVCLKHTGGARHRFTCWGYPIHNTVPSTDLPMPSNHIVQPMKAAQGFPFSKSSTDAAVCSHKVLRSQTPLTRSH